MGIGGSVLDIDAIRKQFPGLNRQVNGEQAVFFDGPAGSQVPQRVADAVSNYLLHTNANEGGRFVISHETDQMLADAHRTAATFFGAADPDTVFFGPNMTSITFAMARALSTQWKAGDEIVVTELEHDGNYTPWIQAAQSVGAIVKTVRLRPEDCTLDMEDFSEKISDRTRLVCVTLASNATGTINPISDIAAMAHQVGALVYVDAVHFAPHGLIDVQTLGCDFLVASTYKFFGPHLGMLWGRRELLESLEVHKVRPSKNCLPNRWMTGTPNLEGMAGAAEAIKYIGSLGGAGTGNRSLRDGLCSAYEQITEYERTLVTPLISGLQGISGVRIWGITDVDALMHRVPTVSFTHDRLSTHEIADRLGAMGIFVWSGNHYAVPFTEAVGIEPGGTLRVGLLHYNTQGEVGVLLKALNGLLVAQ